MLTSLLVYEKKNKVNPHSLPLIIQHPPSSLLHSLGNRALILVIALDEAHWGAAGLAWARCWGLIWPLGASCWRQGWFVLLIQYGLCLGGDWGPHGL